MEAINRQQIEVLLQRYFEAETDIQEERQLKAYFQQETIDPAFDRYRDLFSLAESDRHIEISDDFEEKLLASIQQTPVVRLSIRRVMAIAASITLILIAGWWGMYRTQTDATESMATEDTYEDPEEAYRQVTAALALMSSTMDKGQQMTIQSVAPAQELGVIQMN